MKTGLKKKGISRHDYCSADSIRHRSPNSYPRPDAELLGLRAGYLAHKPSVLIAGSSAKSNDWLN